MTTRERRIADFRDLRFGMFIHYNLATYHGVQWVDGYAELGTFDPGGVVDTDAWADAAVAAGMKYAVLTAKHVGGFCLWDSELTAYGSTHPSCPHPQDVVERFVESFTSRGLKIGLYYCWRSTGFDAKYKVLPPECDPAGNDLDAQLAFQVEQVQELLERFPQAFYVWIDALDDLLMPADEFRRRMDPSHADVLHSGNWWDWGRKGEPFLDIAVTETKQFPAGNTLPGETCWCLEESWFHTRPSEPKPAADMVEQLRIANSRNANFLLNVGPDQQGQIQDSSRALLAEIGRLLAK